MNNYTVINGEIVNPFNGSFNGLYTENYKKLMDN